MDTVTEEVWAASHPYLRSIADFHEKIETALGSATIPKASTPRWTPYISDFRMGVPLLRSSNAGIDIRSGEGIVAFLIEAIASTPLPHPLTEAVRTLADELCGEVDKLRRALIWLIHEDGFVPAHPGLFRYLGWTALARFLSPAIAAFARSREEEEWLRNYCPTCGSLPAMAQLAGNDPGRIRLLSCGCCRTRWRFLRTGCPFCANQDDHRLAVWCVEGQPEIRIDYCELCRGYLKTYMEEGGESLWLADWTSLHLDIVACDRGLRRMAASLYEL